MGTRKKIILYSISAALVFAVAYFSYRYRGKIAALAIPFFIAIFISYLITPLVNRMERKKIPKMAGILIVYALFSLIGVSLCVFIVPEIINNSKELMTRLPEIVAEYSGMFNGLLKGIALSNWPAEIKNSIFLEMNNGAGYVQEFLTSSLKKSLGVLTRTATTIFDIILAMIIAYYFVKDGELFKKSALALVPKKFRNGLVGTGKEINGVLANFIQGQLLTALIVGTMETIGLFIVGVKYPVILGIFGGVANIIPYFGPIIGAIPALAVALLDSPIKAIWAGVMFLIVQQIDNAFISPKIIEGRLGLHPVTTILAVLVGGEFFGIIGMLVAVPIMAILKIILKRTVEAIV